MLNCLLQKLQTLIMSDKINFKVEQTDDGNCRTSLRNCILKSKLCCPSCDGNKIIGQVCYMTEMNCPICHGKEKITVVCNQCYGNEFIYIYH